MNIKRFLGFGCMLGLFLGSSAKTIDVYVSQQVSGQGDGSKNNPFVSLQQVTEKLKELRASGNIDPVNVCIALGLYELEAPLRMTSEQNSGNDGMVTFRSWGKGDVVLSGGRHITDWVEIESNHWVAELPEVKNGNWYFRQLFSGHKRLVRARTPNEGFFRTKGGLSIIGKANRVLGDSEKEAKFWLSRCGFAYTGDDVRYWDDWQNAEILTFHSWECSWQSILSIDTLKNEVYFTSPCRYPVGNFGQNMRYRIENIREALDEAGEWFLDRKSGKLHLLTNEGENPKEMNIHAPRLERIVDFEGTAQYPIANVQFENIDFQYTSYRMGLYDIAPNWPAEIQKSIPYFPSDIRPGFTGAQAAPTAGASLHFEYADNITFGQCGMRHLGAIGVAIAKGCRGIKLNGCEISDTGAGGIYIGFDIRQVKEAGVPERDVPRDNVISNCLITSLGHVHPAAVGVWMAQTSNNKILKNEISYVSYSGVSMGWTWAFDPNYTKNNYIAHNYIHHVAQTLGDAAGIYSLGDCEGSVYDGNYIDQIYKGEGVYGVVDAMGFDECSSKITIKNTVVGKVSGKVASFGRSSSAELQTWENNNFDMNTPRPVFDNRPGMDAEQLTVHACFHPISTFLNLSGRKEQRWIVRKNGSFGTDGFYGMLIQGKQAVAYLNIGGGNDNLYEIASGNVVEDDKENTVAFSYDGKTFRFYFNDELVGEKTVDKKRTPGKGKLEIAPISSNSLRNGIQKLYIANRAIVPAETANVPASFSWTAPKPKRLSIDVQKVIREAGPDEKYLRHFAFQAERGLKK